MAVDRVELIVVGASLGGLDAVGTLLGGLPSDLGVPIVIAQHRGPSQDGALAKLLAGRSPLSLAEPEDKAPLVPGLAYVAPAEYHVLVERGHVALSTDAPVNHARPSIDVLFESAAVAYGAAVACVVLTGTGQDGARGARRIKEKGGMVVVEDPSTAHAKTMPEAAIAETEVDAVLPLAAIAPFLVGLCKTGRTARGEVTR